MEIIRDERGYNYGVFMSTTDSQISSFITTLESHPRATELIPLVEQLFNVDDFSAEAQLTAILLDICGTDPSLITDLWLLRGTILLEEGLSLRAIAIFWEAVHIQPTELDPWEQVIQIFISREELINASYFLTKAQIVFPENSDLSSLLQNLTQQILMNLQNVPGVTKDGKLVSISLTSPMFQEGTRSLNRDSTLVIFPDTFHNPWKMTHECFKESNVSSNQKDKQAFITYAHSAMLELLGLDGNFREGLDQALIRFQLTTYKQPLMFLNRIRNQVVHANTIPSKKEIQRIYSLVQEIVTHFEEQFRQNQCD